MDAIIQGFVASAKPEIEEPQDTKDQEPEDIFHDAVSENDDCFWCSSESFTARVMKAAVDEEKMRFFDPSDDMSEKSMFGKAFHLLIDYDAFETAREEEHQFVQMRQRIMLSKN